MTKLLEFVRRTMVAVSFGDFDGMKEPGLEDLYALRGLVDFAIKDAEAAARSESHIPN